MSGPVERAKRACSLRRRLINLSKPFIPAAMVGESGETGAAANNLDLYQVNCTFYDALGRRETST